MSHEISLEKNFKNHVEAVKQRQMTWNIFQNSVEDFSHSDIYRLKLFNAILLTELTMNYSQGRHSNQCHRAMALVVFCLASKPCFKNLPRNYNTLKYIAQKASRPRSGTG